MGYAAYQRGSLSKDLTSISMDVGTKTIFQETVVRRLGTDWLVMNRKDNGFGEYGVTYPSLLAVARAYRVTWEGFFEDQHSVYAVIAPVGD